MNEILFHFFNTLAGHSQILDKIIVFCAVWLGNLTLIGVILFVVLYRDKQTEPRTTALLFQKAKEVVLVLSSAFAAWGAAQFFKYLFATDRPFVVRDVVLLFEHTGYAFPSGHATFFSALAVAVYRYHKRFGMLLGGIALVVGVARIVAGVHFPIDIIGGFVLGPVVTIAVHRMLRWFGRKYGIL
ncbi:MAG: phosphatase PAP2 family protein [Candidatus Pacebacteria bacterium]|jgi:undecaprenyl-diphosphatase|nr:phosphatase PAP2 family protein [Candidatus Paceibacterota bacterium]